MSQLFINTHKLKDQDTRYSLFILHIFNVFSMK